MVYKVVKSKRFDKQYKKLSNEDRLLTKEVIAKLSNGQKLEAKYHDHPYEMCA